MRNWRDRYVDLYCAIWCCEPNDYLRHNIERSFNEDEHVRTVEEAKHEVEQARQFHVAKAKAEFAFAITDYRPWWKKLFAIN